MSQDDTKNSLLTGTVGDIPTTSVQPSQPSSSPPEFLPNFLNYAFSLQRFQYTQRKLVNIWEERTFKIQQSKQELESLKALARNVVDMLEELAPNLVLIPTPQAINENIKKVEETMRQEISYNSTIEQIIHDRETNIHLIEQLFCQYSRTKEIIPSLDTLMAHMEQYDDILEDNNLANTSSGEVDLAGGQHENPSQN